MEKMYKCENCGASLTPDNETSRFIQCEYCGEKTLNPLFKEKNEIKIKIPDISKDFSFESSSKDNKQKFSIFVFVLLLIFFWPAAIIYLILFAVKSSSDKK